MPFDASDEQLIHVAKQYVSLVDRAKELVGQAPPNLLSGSASSTYLKRMGHRSLTADDITAIIGAVGSEEDKAVLAAFGQAQQELNERLDRTKPIGLVLKQAGIPYDQAYNYCPNHLCDPSKIKN